MEDNRCEYGFGGDGQSYADSNYMYTEQDTAYVIRPEQMNMGTQPARTKQRTMEEQ